MALRITNKGLPAEYLKKTYNYDGSINLKFFEERVWWWRLLNHFKDDTFTGKEHLNNWVSRVEKNPQQADLENENKDWIFENGELKKPLSEKERRKWRREKYLIWLKYLNDEIGYNKSSVFEYEFRSKVGGKYKRGKNWLELGERAKHSDIDVISELTWLDPTLFRPGSDFVRPTDQLFDLRKADYSLVKQFKGWLKIQRKKTGIYYRKPKTPRGNRPLSWKPLELLDIDTHRLEGYPLEGSERSQVSKVMRKYYKLFSDLIDRD